MGIRLFQVDAFTDKAFAGNPTAACLLPAPRDDAWTATGYGWAGRRSRCFAASWPEVFRHCPSGKDPLPETKDKPVKKPGASSPVPFFYRIW